MSQDGVKIKEKRVNELSSMTRVKGGTRKTSSLMGNSRVWEKVKRSIVVVDTSLGQVSRY